MNETQPTSETATYPRWWAVCDDCGTATTWEAHDDRGEDLPDPSEWEEFKVCLVCGSSLIVGDSENDRTWDVSARLTARLNTLRVAAAHPHKGVADTDASMLREAAERADGGHLVGGSHTSATVGRVLRAVADILDGKASR